MALPDEEITAALLRELEAGRSATLITLARSFGSAPRPSGALLAVFEDGAMVGSVSGGCVEEHVRGRLHRAGDRASFPRIETFGITPEDARRHGLPCGGQLELLVERVREIAPWREIAAVMNRRECVARRVCLNTGEVSLHRATRTQEFSFDGQTLARVFGPQWRLVVIGAGHLTQALIPLAESLDYQVIVCDPRTQADAAQQSRVPVDRRMPDEVVVEFARDARTAVLALTHDANLDDLAVAEALRSPAFYVGALGSRATNDKRRERLAWLGVAPEHIARLRGPVGVDLGGRSPGEIAVAIVADLAATRNGVVLTSRRVMT